MVLGSALFLTAILQDLPDPTSFSFQRIGKSGLIVNLPQGQEIKELSENQYQVNVKADNFNILITLTKTSNPPNLRELFIKRAKEMRTKLKDKVSRQTNYPTLGTQKAYGATDSFGLYIEGKEKGINSLFWSGIIADGWFIETEAETEIRFKSLLESIVATYRLVNPDTGEYRSTPIEGLEIEVIGGGSFSTLLLPSGQPVSPTSKVISANHIPISGFADLWPSDSVEMDNPDQVAGKLRTLIMAGGQHSRIELNGKAISGEPKKVEVTGRIPIQDGFLSILGRVVETKNGAFALVTLFNDKSKDSHTFAQKMVQSIKPKVAETEPFPPKMN